MAADSGTESVGLRGAKAIGDKRVSTLLDFSWASLRASSLVKPVDQTQARAERRDTNAEPVVQRRRRGKAG